MQAKRLTAESELFLVDKLGFSLEIKVTGANISENQSGILSINLLRGKISKLKKIAADNGLEFA